MTTPHKALLQQALDALGDAYMHTTDRSDYRTFKAAAEALQAALDEPEPEPVAVLIRWRALHNERIDINPWMAIEIDKYRPNPSRDEKPLYLHPPAARQPLDDETIFQIACGAADEMWPGVGGVGWTKEDAEFFRIFCRKIEAAVRAKP